MARERRRRAQRLSDQLPGADETHRPVWPDDRRRLAARLRRRRRSGRSGAVLRTAFRNRSEEQTSELQSLMRISYAVFCLKKKKNTINNTKMRQRPPNTIQIYT